MSLTEREKWHLEYRALEHAAEALILKEEAAKQYVKTLERHLKEETRKRNRLTKARKLAQKQVKTFWSKKNGVLYRRRQWASANPGEALKVVESVT